jgi:hypothetical protein
MLEFKEKALSIVKQKGPIIPSDICAELKSSLMFTSAVLSELVSKKQVLITNTKVGSSPAYYFFGQESRLQGLSKYLSEKPRKAFELLKEKKILKDAECEPWQRVALREIKDFAVMLNVSNNGNEAVFWKWYLLSDDIAREIIGEHLKKDSMLLEENKAEEEPKNDIVQEEKQAVLQDAEKPAQRKRRKKESEDIISARIFKYLHDNKINIISSNVIKNNSELNLLIKMPSAVGEINMFTKVKSKRKISESDLSLAYSEARGIPILFLSNGELSKKAKTFADKNLAMLVFKKISF